MTNRFKIKHTMVRIPVLAALAVAGCAGPPAVVRPGDVVAISFTCRTPNGELAATTLTDKKVAAEKKSPLYLPQTGSEEQEVTALPSIREPYLDRQAFELEIVRGLAGRVAGMKEGEHALLELQAESYPKQGAKDGETRIARVLKRTMERRVAIDSYASRKLTIPEVGKKVMFDSNVPATVTEVTDKEVVMRAMVEPGHEYLTPFGSAVARITADGYELVIDAKPGRLVRTGTMAGRISAVDGDIMTINYNHPFGGEKLDCDVRIDRIIRKAPASEVSLDAKKPEDPTNPGGGDQASVSAELMSKAMKFADKDASQASSANIKSKNEQGKEIAGAGDLAAVDYDVRLEDGTLFYTTRKVVAEDSSVKKSTWFTAPAAYAPEAVTVGKEALFPGIGEALVGMTGGEKKRLTLPAENAFGQSDPKKLVDFPVSRTLPRKVKLSAEEYLKRFTSFPTIGQDVPLTPFFPARVTAVREKEVELAFQVEDGANFSEPYGVTTVKVSNDNIITTLKPVIGAGIPMQEGTGIITATDGTSFTVDSNHPLAGKGIVIDLEMISLTKAAD